MSDVASEVPAPGVRSPAKGSDASKGTCATWMTDSQAICWRCVVAALPAPSAPAPVAPLVCAACNGVGAIPRAEGFDIGYTACPECRATIVAPAPSPRQGQAYDDPARDIAAQWSQQTFAELPPMTVDDTAAAKAVLCRNEAALERDIRAALEEARAEGARLRRDWERMREERDAAVKDAAEAEARVGVHAVRPVVWAFAHAMEAKLALHDEKRGPRGWMGDAARGLARASPLYLLKRTAEEFEELRAVVYRGEFGIAVLEEAADVANLAMMVADVCEMPATRALATPGAARE